MRERKEARWGISLLMVRPTTSLCPAGEKRCGEMRKKVMLICDLDQMALIFPVRIKVQPSTETEKVVSI